MDTIQVSVTQEYLDRGARRDAELCPIALALVGMGYQEVIVDGVEVTWYAEGWNYTHILPKDAQKFIAAFDKEEGAAPFQFELELEYGEPRPFLIPADQITWWDLELALLSPMPVGAPA